MPPRTVTQVASPASQHAALLVEDPDLALGVPAEDRELAERLVLVPTIESVPGPLVLVERTAEPTLGVLVLSGYATATTTFAEQSTDQLLGPGHIVQTATAPDGLLPVLYQHEALTDVRLAVLDRRFIAAVRRWPGLLIAVHARLCEQQRHLAVHAAIGRLRRSEDRVLAVLWQIAEQWGHVTAAGITLPVRLTHSALGRLAGASRSTTSLALAALEEEGRLRRAGSQLILHPDSSMILKRAVDRTPRAPRPDLVTAEAERARMGREALSERVAALHSSFDSRVRGVDEILAASREVAARSAETRKRLRATRLGTT